MTCFSRTSCKSAGNVRLPVNDRSAARTVSSLRWLMPLHVPKEEDTHFFDVLIVDFLLNQLYHVVTETDSEDGYLFFLTIGPVLPRGSLLSLNCRIISLCDRTLADVLCLSSSVICSVVWGVKLRRVRQVSRRYFIDGLRK